MKTEDVVLQLAPAPGAGLPPARLLLTVNEDWPNRRKVTSACLRVERPRGAEIESHEFDGGRVVVDVDESGEFVALEVLAATAGPHELPELFAFIQEHQPPLLEAAIATTMRYWIDLAGKLEMEDCRGWTTSVGMVFFKDARAATRNRVLTKQDLGALPTSWRGQLQGT